LKDNSAQNTIECAAQKEDHLAHNL